MVWACISTSGVKDLVSESILAYKNRKWNTMSYRLTSQEPGSQHYRSIIFTADVQPSFQPDITAKRLIDMLIHHVHFFGVADT